MSKLKGMSKAYARKHHPLVNQNVNVNEMMAGAEEGRLKRVRGDL